MSYFEISNNTYTNGLFWDAYLYLYKLPILICLISNNTQKISMIYLQTLFISLEHELINFKILT